jgi:hypothetical protein
MDVVDLAVAGTANISTTGGTTTLDNVDYVADNGKAAILNVSGVLGSNATIVIPNASKTYIVVNGTSGAFSLTIKTSSGSGITIPQGYTQKVRCDGSDGTSYVTPAIAGASGAFPSIELGHASDTTLTRVSSGVVAIEGVNILTTATGQPLDADLTAIAGLSPSNDDFIQRKAGAWTNRTMTQLIADLAALGTTFQPLDSDLTAIAALTTTAAGRSALAIADPNADRIMAWDDSAGSFAAIALADITTEAAPAGGDYLLAYTDAGALVKIDWSDLPGGGSSATTALDNLASVAINTTLLPGSNDGAALGSGTLAFSDLFLASGGVINFNNGDVTVTHSANTLAFAGASSGYTFDDDIALTNANPVITLTDSDTNAVMRISANSAGGSAFIFADSTNAVANSVLGFGIDGTTTQVQLESASWRPATGQTFALGSTTQGWSALHLISTGVINFASSDWVATHSTGILTVGTGDLRVTTAGTNTASVVTVGGTQTLTNKTLTSPVINTGTIGTSLLPTSNDGAALGASGTAFADLFLASGGVINFNAGNYTLTHSAGLLTANGALSLGTSNAFTCGTIELGAASDTTVSRSAAGVIAVEGVPLYSNMPVNSQSAAYTTVLADAQKFILHPTADNNARTFTIDSNANVAYPIGTTLTFINQINTVTISITSDTLTFAGPGSTGSRTLAANGLATAIKVATTSWVISGVGLS